MINKIRYISIIVGLIISIIVAFYVGNIISKPIIKITSIIKKTHLMMGFFCYNSLGI